MAMVRRRIGGYVRATNNINLIVTGHSGNNITITVPAGLSVSEGMIIVFKNNFGINSTSNPAIYANRIYYVRNPSPSPITTTGTINLSLAPSSISSVVWPVNTGTAVTGVSIPAVTGDSIGMTYYLNTSPLSADQTVPTPGVFNLAKQAQMSQSGIWPEDLKKTISGNTLIVGGGGNGGQYNGGSGGGVYNGSVSFNRSILLTATIGGGGGNPSNIVGYGFNLVASGGGNDGGASGSVILNGVTTSPGYNSAPSVTPPSTNVYTPFSTPQVNSPTIQYYTLGANSTTTNSSTGGGGGGAGGAGNSRTGGSSLGNYGGGGGAGGFIYTSNTKTETRYYNTYNPSTGGWNPLQSNAYPTFYTNAYSQISSVAGGTNGGASSSTILPAISGNPSTYTYTTTYNVNNATAGGVNTGGGGGGGAYGGISPQVGGAAGGSGQLQVTIPAERYNVTYPYINSMSTTLSTTNVTLTGSGKFAV